LDKEEIRTPKLPFKFEDDLSKDLGNTSNSFCKRKPSIPVTSIDPIETFFHRENVEKWMAIISGEWSREPELSSEVLDQLSSSNHSLHHKGKPGRHPL